MMMSVVALLQYILTNKTSVIPQTITLEDKDKLF